MKRLLMLSLLLCVSTLFAELPTITLRFGQEYFTPSGRWSNEIPDHLRPCFVPLILQFLPEADLKALEQFSGETYCERAVRRFCQYYGSKETIRHGAVNSYNNAWTLLQSLAAQRSLTLEPSAISADVVSYTWQADKKMVEVTIKNPHADALLEVSGTLMNYKLPLTTLKPNESVTYQWTAGTKSPIKNEVEKGPLTVITPVFVNGKAHLFTLSVPVEHTRHVFYPRSATPQEKLQIAAPCQDWASHPMLSTDDFGIYFSLSTRLQGKKKEQLLSLLLYPNAVRDYVMLCCDANRPAQITINDQTTVPLTFKDKPVGYINGNPSPSTTFFLNEKVLATGNEKVSLKACFILPNGRHLRVDRDTTVLPIYVHP